MEGLVRKIGIMGGTFDPIHYGHLVTAEVARYGFGLDEVIFVPAGTPPHKVHKVVSPAQYRYELALLATASNPSFRVSDFELKRQALSYTYHTVMAFKELYAPAQGKLEIYFITGADAVLEIMSWHRFDELLQECSFIAATRPGYGLDRLSLPAELKQKVFFLEVPALAISSTDIRRRVAAGEPIKYLLPESVENYIYQNGLYRR